MKNLKLEPKLEMSVGRTFHNIHELREWVKNGQWLHWEQKNGKLNVLIAPRYEYEPDYEEPEIEVGTFNSPNYEPEETAYANSELAIDSESDATIDKLEHELGIDERARNQWAKYHHFDTDVNEHVIHKARIVKNIEPLALYTNAGVMVR